MKRLASLLAIVVAVASLSACSSQRAGGTPTGMATALTAASADHLVTRETPWAKDTIQDPATVITTAGNTSLPWLFVSRSTDDRSLRLVWVAGGGCTTFDGVLIKETASTVTITVSGTTDWRAKACAANLLTGGGTVSLASPLGNRTLWHAPVNEAWVAPGRVLSGE